MIQKFIAITLISIFFQAVNCYPPRCNHKIGLKHQHHPNGKSHKCMNKDGSIGVLDLDARRHNVNIGNNVNIEKENDDALQNKPICYPGSTAPGCTRIRNQSNKQKLPPLVTPALHPSLRDEEIDFETAPQQKKPILPPQHQVFLPENVWGEVSPTGVNDEIEQEDLTLPEETFDYNDSVQQPNYNAQEIINYLLKKGVLQINPQTSNVVDVTQGKYFPSGIFQDERNFEESDFY